MFCMHEVSNRAQSRSNVIGPRADATGAPATGEAK